jgi:hypothetical protein
VHAVTTLAITAAVLYLPAGVVVPTLFARAGLDKTGPDDLDFSMWFLGGVAVLWPLALVMLATIAAFLFCGSLGLGLSGRLKKAGGRSVDTPP